MTSVFAFPSFRRSTLTFTIPGVESVNSRGDAESGGSVVTIEAYLVRRRVMPKLTGSEVATVGTADLEGRLISPVVLPAGLIEGSIGTGVINGENGVVELLPASRDGLTAIELVMGQRIRVRFSRRSTYAGVS